MTDLEKYQRVNKCETIDELVQTIRDFSLPNGLIQGVTRIFDGEEMARGCELAYKGVIPPNVVTRNFGLRQQLLYLMYINKILK